MITIYKITNITNNKIYIGQTVQLLKSRWAVHCAKKSTCKYLSNAIQFYGKDKFNIEVITFCGTQECANQLEDTFIDKYDSCNPEKGYNIKRGGANGAHSISTKQKMSKVSIGKPKSEEHKKAIALARTGKPLSEKHKKTISDSVKANYTEEHKEAIRQSNKKRTA